MWAFIRKIKTSPIYLREQGKWGEPNPYYATLMRYLPLVLIVVLGLGVFCGSYQFSSFIGLNEWMGFIILLVCLPNIVLQALTWIGVLLAPALTAPSVVEEIDRGSWEILRLTPMPTMHIIIAKFLGSMSRLKIWWPLLIVSVIYALAIGVGSVLTLNLTSIQDTFLVEPPSNWQMAGWAIATTLSALIRPWLDIGFSGLVGLTLSLWTKSARAALIGTYAIVFIFRIVLWTIVGTVFSSLLFSFGYEIGAFSFGQLGMNLLYLLCSIGLFFALRYRARSLEAGELMYE